MDKIFKALSDPHRLILLDALKEKDGQSLSQLEVVLADLSRFGVMKHLKVLEGVALITCRKEGRFKYHYLNVVPLQEISDRWISRFAAPWAKGMVDLKHKIEGVPPMTNKPAHVFTTIIQTSKEALWTALTDPKQTQLYFFGLSVKTTWKEEADITYLRPDGSPEIMGKVLEVEPFKKLVHSFCGQCNKEEKKDPFSRVTYEIEEMGQACKLTLIHDEFGGETETYKGTGNGWPLVISGLKTLLETGEPLEMEMAKESA